MTNLKTLINMQLKDKLSRSKKNNTANKIKTIISQILKIVIFTSLVYLAFMVLKMFKLISSESVIPINAFALLFITMIILSVFVSTKSIINHLYLAKDNQFLFTLPVSKTQLYFSKYIVFVITDFIRNLTFFLPVMLALGLINEYSILFFLWIPLAIVLTTLLIVSISALLSIPLSFISSFLKSNKIVSITFSSTILTLSIFALYGIIRIIPEDINLVAQWSLVRETIERFLLTVPDKMPLTFHITNAFLGQSKGSIHLFFNASQLLSLLYIVLITTILTLSTIFIIKPLFFKMASKSNEYKRKANAKIEKNIKRTSYLSEMRKDFILSIRNSNKFVSIIYIAIALPLSIFLLNKVFSVMDVRIEGRNMIYAFNILMITLIATSSNSMVAKTFSEDGKAGYLIKNSPTNPIKPILARLTIQSIVISSSILAATIIAGSMTKFNAKEIFLMFSSIELFYLAHMLRSALMDLMNPQNHHYATSGSSINNPNENKATLTAFVTSAIVALLTFMFVSENYLTVFNKVVIFAILYLAITIYMFINKIKVYYQEK